MPFPSWQDFLSEMWSFEQRAKKKKAAFQGHDSILEVSIQASFLFFPKPLDIMAKVSYEDEGGTPVDRIDRVINIFNKVKDRGQENYNNVKRQLDNIISTIEGTVNDPVRKGNEDLIKKMRQILTSNEDDRNHLLQELNGLIVKK